MKKPAPVFYWVVCSEWTLGPFQTEERAQRGRDGVVRLGACKFDHEILTTNVPGRRPRSRFARY